MLTQKRLKELLHYDPMSGVFTNKEARGPLHAGEIAGHLHKDGYWRLRLRGNFYESHRLAELSLGI